MLCSQSLLGTLGGTPTAPAALPFAPGAAAYAVFLAAALVLAVVWRRRLPEWAFPVRGRWLRYLLTGIVSAAVATTYLFLCSTTRFSETPLLW